MTFCPKCGSKLTPNQSCGKCGIIWGEVKLEYPTKEGIIESINNNQEKQTFKSGATSSEQLPGYDMLPELFLTRTAKRFDLGKVKHGKFNYRKGLKDKEFIIDRLNHAFLHLKKAIDLIELDQPFDDDNLAAVAVNIAMAMEYELANFLINPYYIHPRYAGDYKEYKERSILTDDQALKTAVKEGQKLGAMKMPDDWNKK